MNLTFSMPETAVLLYSVSMAIALIGIYRGRYNKPVTPVTLGWYLIALMLWLAALAA